MFLVEIIILDFCSLHLKTKLSSNANEKTCELILNNLKFLALQKNTFFQISILVRFSSQLQQNQKGSQPYGHQRISQRAVRTSFEK